VPAFIFAGDRHVWRATFVVAVPLVALIAFYCLRPRDYYTGTDSVEAYTYVGQAAAHERLCVPGLQLPAGTARVRVQLISLTQLRPELDMRLQLARRLIRSELPPVQVSPSRISSAVFAIPTLPSRPAAQPASLCLTGDDVVNFAGTPLPAPPRVDPPTLGRAPVSARVSLWYQPPSGAQRSYLGELGDTLRRASLFRPSVVGPWLYVLLLFIVLPLLALAAVRCLALAAAHHTRRMALWLFAIAALNFACWALITPPFQAPDEVDHFAYTQSLVERGEPPSRDPASPLARWSSSENLALEDMNFFTDHQIGDTRLPWLASQERFYLEDVRAQHPRASDGGGNETAATHGPIYYSALAPAYLLASSSPFSQLTLMRLTSALIGALTVLFAYLLARELAPRLEWLAVLAALLVAYQPMYGFISGAVNNDVGVNAGAAALELLLIRMLRRGPSVPWAALTAALLLLLPVVKGTAYSLYPLAAIALLATLWRHHRRSDAPAWAAFVAAAVVARALSTNVSGALRPSAGNTPGPGAVSSTGRAIAEYPLGYLAYVWQVFLPRLSFMAPHWETTNYPGFVIFVERGWGAFGWYDVFFTHWVYVVILIVMLCVPLLGIVVAFREWPAVSRRLPEIAVLALTPLAVIFGFEAAFYTPGTRNLIPEFGRYTFPAIAPLAVLVAGSILAFGRRRASQAGAGLLAAMLGLSYAGQVLTLTGFYG
jgi:hypothetical protein